MASCMPSVQFEIKQTIAYFSEEKSGWTKELSLISWNGHEPKYDIRSWSSDYTKMRKGITFSNEELISLKDVLNELI